MNTDTYNSQLKDQIICVTGAGGFIGKEVVRELVKGGAVVKAILRTHHSAEAMRSLGAEPLIVNLLKPEVATKVFDGADQVVHLAYDIRASAEENLSLFQSICKGGKVAQIQRLIHMSSIVVYDDWMKTDLSETSPISTSSGGPYRQAKIEMERWLEGAVFQGVALQPTLVYGPGSPLWTMRILDALRAGEVVLPQEEGVCNPVYVADVAQAVARAATEQMNGFSRYIISGEPATWHDFYAHYQSLIPGSSLKAEPSEALRARLGPRAIDQPGTTTGPTLSARLSAQARRVLGNERFEGLIQTAKKIRSGQGPQYPDHKALDLLTAKGVCSYESAKRKLGYSPEFDLDRGMDEIAKSLKN